MTVFSKPCAIMGGMMDFEKDIDRSWSLHLRDNLMKRRPIDERPYNNRDQTESVPRWL